MNRLETRIAPARPSHGEAPRRLTEIEHVFGTYWLLGNKQVEVLSWSVVGRARNVLREDRARYLAGQASGGAGGSSGVSR